MPGPRVLLPPSLDGSRLPLNGACAFAILIVFMIAPDCQHRQRRTIRGGTREVGGDGCVAGKDGCGIAAPGTCTLRCARSFLIVPLPLIVQVEMTRALPCALRAPQVHVWLTCGEHPGDGPLLV